MNTLYEAIETIPPGYGFRPDSALLTPEVVVRDLENFNMSMGNGFHACLGYGGGFTMFFRALRAVRIIQHKKGIALAEAVRDVMVANGAREPSIIADDNHEGTDVDWDKELDMAEFFNRIEKPILHLDEVDEGWHDIVHSYWNRRNRVLVPGRSAIGLCRLQISGCQPGFTTLQKGISWGLTRLDGCAIAPSFSRRAQILCCYKSFTLKLWTTPNAKRSKRLSQHSLFRVSFPSRPILTATTTSVQSVGIWRSIPAWMLFGICWTGLLVAFRCAGGLRTDHRTRPWRRLLAGCRHYFCCRHDFAG